MVDVASRWSYDGQFVLILILALVLPETDLQVDGVELDVDCIVGCKGEALARRVEFLDGVGPGVAVSRNQITAMADVAIVEVVVRRLYHILQADSDPYPSHELLHLEGPLAGLV